MIVGIGIDSVLLKRIKAKLSPAFIGRFFKSSEIVYFNHLSKDALKVDYLAKLWAIKEACVKAFPTPTSFADFTIQRTAREYCLVEPDDYKCKISVTCDQDRVMAICILETKDV